MKLLEKPDGKVRRYWVYGLILDSALPFPELVEIPDDGTAADVVLRFGKVDVDAPEWIAISTDIRCTPTAMLCILSEDCQFVCQNGNELIVQITDRFSMIDLRNYMLGTGMAAIMQQGDRMPFHVSAVESPQGAWAFTGPSGAGKSTAAALLAKMTGWPLITDDVALIEIVAGKPMISGGVTKLKLWHDVLDMLQLDAADAAQDSWRPGKFHFVQNRQHRLCPVILKKLFVIKPDIADDGRRVEGFAKVDAVADAVFRHFSAHLYATKISTANLVFELAGKIEVSEISRPNTKALKRILEDFV